MRLFALLALASTSAFAAGNRVVEPVALPAVNVSGPKIVPSASAPLLPEISLAPLVPTFATPAAMATLPVEERHPVVAGLIRLSGPQTPQNNPSVHYDGGKIVKPTDALEPASGNIVPTDPPRLDPPTPPAPKGDRRTVAGRVLRSAALGVALTSAAPALWSALPTSTSLLLFGVSILPVLAAATLLTTGKVARAIYRVVTKAPAKPARPAPTKRALLKIRAVGLALGLSLTLTTVVYHKPLIQAGYTYVESLRPASEKEFKTTISGKFFGEETARVLAQTPEGRAALDRVRGRDGVLRMPEFSILTVRQKPVPIPGAAFAETAKEVLSRTADGRKVLDGLRDRGGVVRMPDFFVSDQDASDGLYTPPDVIFLDVATIEAGGVTIEEFLRDPAAQRAYLEREQALIVHELTHAVQARRSPFRADVRTFVKTNASRLAGAIYDYVSGKTVETPPSETTGDATETSAPAPKTAVAAPEISAAPIVLDAAQINREGLTVAEFLNDPKAQAEYIVRHQAELARQLKPAAVVAIPGSKIGATSSGITAATSSTRKRAPFEVNFAMIQEWEYEAYLTAHLYTHARLKADPGSVAISESDLGSFGNALQDFDAYLKSIDESEIYKHNVRSRSEDYERYLSDLRAGWDAHRVECHLLLARRAQALGDRDEAKAQLESAKKLAAEKGLPEPKLTDAR